MANRSNKSPSYEKSNKRKIKKDSKKVFDKIFKPPCFGVGKEGDCAGCSLYQRCARIIYRKSKMKIELLEGK